MSSTRDLVNVLKAELRSAGVTYADLAPALGLSESSVKRSFARGDMPLSRIDAVLRVLNLDFAELARQVADRRPPAASLTPEQEAAVVADRRLLLIAICCLSQWTVEAIVRTYAVSEAECVHALAQLDRIGILELKPHNRYCLRVAKAFRWLPHGPVMRYFREHVAGDFLAGGFDGPHERLTLVHGQIPPHVAASLGERLQRLCDDFAQAHRAERGSGEAPGDRVPYTMLVAMRSWLFAAFRDLKRGP